MRKLTATVFTALAVSSLLPAVALLAAQPPADLEEGTPVIRAGTELARLVREVEPHKALFSPAEKAQRIRVDIPDWLRAHYRRNHPAMRTAVRELDPTGGYPLALESLYIWMLYHQDLQPSPPPPASMPLRIAAVGSNLRISARRSRSGLRASLTSG